MTRRATDRPARGRILLVEDHVALANLRRDFLAGAGYEAVCSGSGEEAIRLLESQSFQLVVADALLEPSGRCAEMRNGAARPASSMVPPARVSGWDVAAVAKQHGVPVILSSGWPVRLGARELRNRGINYLCPKPCSQHQLLQLIEDSLRKPSSPRPAPRPPAGLVRKAQYERHGKKSDH